MRIGIPGTGTVGQTLGTKLAGVGHDVRLGARDARNEKAAAWAADSPLDFSRGMPPSLTVCRVRRGVVRLAHRRGRG
jgi:predicted dinucleotide-binding enzyme